MDLDEIRTFVTIARERSFSGAAGTLGRSQPAISRRIELLESELGAKLFERLRAGAMLTDAGSALLPYAEAMLANGRKHEPRALAGERWVAFPSRRSRESMVDFLERRLTAAGIENHEIIPIDSLSAQKRLVEAGFGIALLAESGIEEELRLGTLSVIKVPALKVAIPVSIVHRPRVAHTASPFTPSLVV